jgi:chromosome partitioning protein
MRSIAVINQKGGTGKTTTVGNLSAGLAMRGRRVLMIDFDPQGALSIWFDIQYREGLYDLISSDLDPAGCVYKARKNLYLLPGGQELREFHGRLESSWWERIREGKTGALEPFDYVLMDCPPSWSDMSRLAVRIAGEVFLPVSMDYLSMIGIRQVVEGVDAVLTEEGTAPEIEMVIPTLYDHRQKKSREIVKVLEWHFGGRVTEPIRANVRLSEAVSYHQSIFEYAPESYGARDYENLVRRVEDVQEAESDGERSPRGDSGSTEGPGGQEGIFEDGS